MSIFVKKSNQWKNTELYHVSNNKTYNLFNQYHKVSNIWKPVYNYTYVTTPWAGCTKSCGTGTQTRTVTCTRNDGLVRPDTYCSKQGLTKPPSIQACNTQACTNYVQVRGYCDDGMRFEAQTDINLRDVRYMGVYNGWGNDKRALIYSTLPYDPDYEYDGVIIVRCTHLNGGLTYASFSFHCVTVNKPCKLLAARNPGLVQGWCLDAGLVSGGICYGMVSYTPSFTIYMVIPVRPVDNFSVATV